MPTPIEEIIVARAADMAAHDGNPVSTVYIVAAGNLVQSDLLSAVDRLLNPPRAVIAAPSAEASVSGDALEDPAEITEPTSKQLIAKATPASGVEAGDVPADGAPPKASA